jgi:hypothetical protein
LRCLPSLNHHHYHHHHHETSRSTTISAPPRQPFLGPLWTTCIIFSTRLVIDYISCTHFQRACRIVGLIFRREKGADVRTRQPSVSRERYCDRKAR